MAEVTDVSDVSDVSDVAKGIVIKAYNYSQLHEITDLLSIFKNIRFTNTYIPGEFKNVEHLFDKIKDIINIWTSSFHYHLKDGDPCKKDDIEKDDIEYEKLFEILSNSPKYMKQLNMIDTIFNEQQVYLSRMHNSNLQWYIIMYYNNIPYAGVFLFKTLDEFFVMQAICKFHVPFLLSLLDPQWKKISVNEHMIPFIENFIRVNTCISKINIRETILYVAPLSVQYKILQEQYDFKKLNSGDSGDVVNRNGNIRDMIDIDTYLGCDWLYKKIQI